MNATRRCDWARSERAIAYHDAEWGVPVHDDHALFEFLVLEGAQAGLSWETVLRKRAAYREAFEGFDPRRVSRYGARARARLLADEGIIRNRLKIDSAIANARVFLEIQAECGSFANYLWGFVGGEPIQNRWRTVREVPARTELSDRISKEWRRRGLRFVGPTIVYAYLQATGVVNDHLVSCFRHEALARPRRRKA